VELTSAYAAKASRESCETKPTASVWIKKKKNNNNKKSRSKSTRDKNWSRFKLEQNRTEQNRTEQNSSAAFYKQRTEVQPSTVCFIETRTSHHLETDPAHSDKWFDILALNSHRIAVSVSVVWENTTVSFLKYFYITWNFQQLFFEFLKYAICLIVYTVIGRCLVTYLISLVR